MAKEYGPWKITGSLSEGGQAHTFLVEHSESGETGVLKRLKNSSPERIARFRRERDALAALNSDHIPSLLDDNTENDPLYLVFEQVPGEDLESFAKKEPDPITVLHIMQETCQVLSTVHQNGICHRDIKPKHIMVKDGHLSGIIDFGLVFWEGQKRVTLLDEAVGSFMYLAPECEDGIADVTPSADIYALGKVIYFTLSGGLQFNREKHREVAYDLAIRNSDPRFEKINELLDCMICGEPADRIQNVSEVAQQIDMITQYFTNVRMERHFTIKEGELCYHAEHWHEIRPGVFSNSNNETRDWSIFGPYVIDPPLDQGLYEVSFKLRYDNSTRNNAADGYLTIDVAASENKVLGARVIAAKALSPRDLITDAKAPDSWRIHSLLFVYLGQEDIEFRVLKDNPLRLGSPYGHSTVEFGGVALRQIAAGRTGS